MIKKIIQGFFLLATHSLLGQADRGTPSVKIQDSGYADAGIPVFSAGGGDAETGIDQQDVSTLLQSGPDVFMQFSSFQFGAGRYRMRGYTGENRQVLINGSNMNNPETGFSTWSSWSGLSDVMPYPEVQPGITANPYSFSGPGGYTYLDVKASTLRKGTRISYANTNRLFQNRLMMTHATGMMENNWAIAISVSSRQGKQAYIPGTFFQSNSFFISAEKQLNNRHLLSFSGFFTPTKQGLAGASQLEAYQLAGTNYYNPLWGYQNGKVRNSTVSRTEQPLLMLTHTYKPDDRSSWTSSVLYTFGQTGITGLNWNNAANPRPDYYRYLPSYYYSGGDPAKGDLLTQNWLNDVNTRQVNWDHLIELNRANLYTLPSQLGQGVNTTETRARYIVEERIENKRQLGLNSTYNKRFGKLFLSAGANMTIYSNRKFKQVNDLLGAAYWLDYDQFAQNLGIDPMIQQNDIDHPDKKIVVGNKFGYDYVIHINCVEAWSQVEYSFKRLEVYGAASISGSNIWKESYVANGKFPTTSKGRSSQLNFFNYGIKGGATYKISGRHFITANALLMTRTPEANNLFISQTVRNDLVSGTRPEQLLSGDMNYLVKYPALKLRLTYYTTQINHQVWLRRYWSDQYNTNINYIMTGVNENHQGVELGLEKNLTDAHLLQAAFGYGLYVYTNRPLAQAWQDNNNVQLFTGRTVYLKNYRVGASPQLVAGIGYKYNARRHWFAGIYFNYFDGIYVEPNPDKRTAEGLDKYSDEEATYVNSIVRQQKLPHYSTINLSAGKSFRIARKYQLRLNLQVNNLLNNKTIITGGYEQLRWDPSNPERFASKYFFMPGATYQANITLNF